MTTLSSHFPRYLAALRLSKAAKTQREYERDISQFLDFIGPVDANSVLPGHIRQYLGALTGNSKSTVARKLAALRSFFRWLVTEGHIASSPLDGIHSPKLEKRLPRFLYASDVEAIMDNVEDARDRAFLELLYSSGLRVSEAVNLTVDAIDFSLGEIRVLGRSN